MKILAIALLSATVCLAQDAKPNVTVEKMTDAEYKRLDDASEALHKAVEAYRKAADAYDSAKKDVLSKYNALESQDCHIQKIIDVRGQYVIVETRVYPTSSWGGLTLGGGCNSIMLTGGGGTISPAIAGTTLEYRPVQ